jgi:hypothetical protein
MSNEDPFSRLPPCDLRREIEYFRRFDIGTQPLPCPRKVMRGLDP